MTVEEEVKAIEKQRKFVFKRKLKTDKEWSERDSVGEAEEKVFDKRSLQWRVLGSDSAFYNHATEKEKRILDKP